MVVTGQCGLVYPLRAARKQGQQVLHMKACAGSQIHHSPCRTSFSERTLKGCKSMRDYIKTQLRINLRSLCYSAIWWRQWTLMWVKERKLESWCQQSWILQWISTANCSGKSPPLHLTVEKPQWSTEWSTRWHLSRFQGRNAGYILPLAASCSLWVLWKTG